MNLTSKKSSRALSLSSIRSRISHSLASGFTLIELLVVIALLAILLVLVVQTVLDARETSRQNAIAGTVKSLNQAQMRAFLSPTLNASKPGYNVPADDLAAVNWYISNGLVRPDNINTNVLVYIERYPLPPSLANEQSIWRKAP
jgi:prepilin-type N-terminal cleavage/methylation domain-containing protein